MRKARFGRRLLGPYSQIHSQQSRSPAVPLGIDGRPNTAALGSTGYPVPRNPETGLVNGDGETPDAPFVRLGEADPARFACGQTDCPLLGVRPQDTLRSWIHCLKCNRRVFPLVKN